MPLQTAQMSALHAIVPLFHGKNLPGMPLLYAKNRRIKIWYCHYLMRQRIHCFLFTVSRILNITKYFFTSRSYSHLSARASISWVIFSISLFAMPSLLLTILSSRFAAPRSFVKIDEPRIAPTLFFS